MKNTLKLILAGMRIATDKVVAKIPKKLSELELDVNLAKHIKDMYYEEIEYVTYISEQNIELENKYSGRVTTNIPDVDMPWDWVPYRVTFDGVEYESVMTDNADTAWLDVTLNDGTNLWINSYGDISIDSEDYVGRHTIKVEQITNKVHIIDSKYLGFPIHAGTGEDAVYLNNNENIASGDYSYAEGGLTTASGDYSHAEGDRTEASGYSSHAEGDSTTASGRSSHAEGDSTTASGRSSHAEGDNATASGDYSHAEGMSTTASGNYSHAEGRGTTVSGRSQHAGGEYNIPEPKFVSVETRIKNSRERICRYRDTLYSSKHGFTYDDVAGLYTLVSLTDGDIETAPQSGERYYIVNGTSGKVVYHQKTYDDIYYDFTNYYAEPGMIKYEIRESATQKGEYAHIVGNGTSNTARSNAHTLDWEGNAWFSGDVYVNSTSGTNRDDGSKKLASEEYVDAAVANADGSPVKAFPILRRESYASDSISDYYINVLDLENGYTYRLITADSHQIYDDTIQLVLVCENGEEKSIAGLDASECVRVSRNEYNQTMYLRTANDSFTIVYKDISTVDSVVIYEAHNLNYLRSSNNDEYIPFEDYNPATKKYVDDTVKDFKNFIVNITMNEDGSYSADKTFDKIVEAYNSGIEIKADMMGMVKLPFLATDLSTCFMFELLTSYNTENLLSGVAKIGITILSDNTVQIGQSDLNIGLPNSLTTTDKTIVGAINELHSKHTEGTDSLTLLSPKGTRFSITVGDDGVLKSTEIVE